MKRSLTLLILSFLISSPLVVSAQSVDLLWQGDTYTPPFYAGKSLWSKQTKVTFLAIPNGLGNPKNLNYLWTKNGTVLGNISGVGKNSLSLMDTVFSKPVTIKVEILSSQEETLAEKSVTLTPTSPTILVYENNPLYGFMFHQEVDGTYKMSGEEATFTGFPFFFGEKNRTASNLLYKWRTSNGEAGTNSVTYRITSGEVGGSSVSLGLYDSDLIMQSANKSFLIQFGNNEQ